MTQKYNGSNKIVIMKCIKTIFCIDIDFCKLATFAVALPMTIALSGQSDKALKKGNEAYKKENYSDAEINYRKSKEESSKPSSSYNLGNSLYRQDKYEDAVKEYELSADKSKSKTAKSNALFNKGNAQIKSKQITEAIESYKQAIRLNPTDNDAKENLIVAKLMQKQNKQQDKQNKDQNKDKDKDKDQKEKKEDKGKNDKNEEKKDNKKDKHNEENGSEQQSQNLNPMDKNQANQTLEMINREEQKVLEKLKRGSSKSRKPAKDW
jgi:Ca-activated chloride channel homolog